MVLLMVCCTGAEMLDVSALVFLSLLPRTLPMKPDSRLDARRLELLLSFPGTMLPNVLVRLKKLSGVGALPCVAYLVNGAPICCGCCCWKLGGCCCC